MLTFFLLPLLNLKEILYCWANKKGRALRPSPRSEMRTVKKKKDKKMPLLLVAVVTTGKEIVYNRERFREPDIYCFPQS